MMRTEWTKWKNHYDERRFKSSLTHIASFGALWPLIKMFHFVIVQSQTVEAVTCLRL